MAWIAAPPNGVTREDAEGGVLEGKPPGDVSERQVQGRLQGRLRPDGGPLPRIRGIHLNSSHLLSLPGATRCKVLEAEEALGDPRNPEMCPKLES